MKFKSNLPEVKETFKAIMQNPESMFELLKIDMKRSCERAVSELIKAELSQFLGREKYERKAIDGSESPNYRNGYYHRDYTVKNIGNLKIKVARDRLGDFESKMINKYDRYDKSIEQDIALMYLSGLSTRGISLISQKLIGRKISSSEVSKVNQELMTGIESWRSRDLSKEKIKYIFVDGVNFDMRVDRSIEKVPMLVAIGVNHNNQRMFLCLQQGDKECASTWREVFKDMKFRGLDHRSIKLGIMDGLTGLESVFREEFPLSVIQRCQVHVARNVISKAPKKLKQEVADNLRDIFYASSRKKAMENYYKFTERYDKAIPSAVQSLKNSIKSCLTFYSFPQEYWVSLRTSNMIERVNKEFKRRTKPMEILAGEKSAYRLLSFIALRMELNWRCAPLGRNNLPSLMKFTQLS
jgi:putative transposase